MIISEVNAGLDLVMKIASLTSQLQDRWYKGKAELEALQNKVWILSAKHGQWSEQLQRYGASEDKHLMRLLKAAEEGLEKQLQLVQKLQKSRFSRWKKMVFPPQLSYLLDQVLERVEAGPNLVAARVANNDMLERFMAQTPALLPFVRDGNYVPITDSVREVRNTLENADGPRIVTVHGGPGMGKSSLVKYLAIHYQEERKRLATRASFPHGVYYVFCGEHAGERIKQLQLELLENLGFGTGSATPNDSAATTSTGVQEGDYIALQSHKMKLRSRLAEQKLLIILDDLWEEKVLQELLVPAEGVKYLLTSQIRDIRTNAEKIQIERPTQDQSSQILANYTEGLPQKGELPNNIQGVANQILRMLEWHPLALANIGISINRSRASDINHWDVIKENLYAHLDENELRSPVAYDKPYNLPVRASMMLMVESLPPEPQRLLFLMALFKDHRLPEPLVKYFYGIIQPHNSLLKYYNHMTFLEDKSLVELIVRGNRSTLGTHGLRTHYIRERKNVESRSIGSQILAASRGEDIAMLIKRGDAEETLVTILSAMSFDRSFKDVVAGTLENHINVINDGVIPRNLNIAADTLDLVESVRWQTHKIHDLVLLLNADREEENWKRQAHEHAKKIIIKFVCQGKLEDKSMACLLKLPQTTLAACSALSILYPCHQEDFQERNYITFSEAYGETMQTLFTLFQDTTISIERRTAVVFVLLDVHNLERKETILNFAAKFVSVVMKSNPNLRDAVTNELACGFNLLRSRSFLSMAEFSGVLESFIAILVSENDDRLRQSAATIINVLTLSGLPALKIGGFPDALKTLSKLFSSKDMLVSNDRRVQRDVRELQRVTGDILLHLSIMPENRAVLGAIEGIWEDLGGILAKLEEAWSVPHDTYDRWALHNQACVAAGTLGYLALEEDLRETIRSWPGVREGLRFLQLIEMAHLVRSSGPLINSRLFYSTRALTVIYSQNHAEERSTDLPPLGDLLEMFPCDELLQSRAMSASLVHVSYWSLYWTRGLAFLQIGSYAEALKNVDLAEHHLDLISTDPKDLPSHGLVWDISSIVCNARTFGDAVWGKEELKHCRMFLQAMLGNYAKAWASANSKLPEIGLVERGVLKRISGDLQGALDDFNGAAMKLAMRKHFTWDIWDNVEVLRQRGYVKYLIGDKRGAKEDAEVAQELKLDRFDHEKELDGQRFNLWRLRKIPVNYLGF